jgi:heme-degrading monooxygenase HmoA
MPYFRLVLQIEVKPGTEQEFEAAWLDIAKDVSGHPGNVAQWLTKSTSETAVFHIVSDWASETAYREFEKADFHLEHRNRLAPYRLNRTITTMHVLHHLDGAAGAVNENGVAE